MRCTIDGYQLRLHARGRPATITTGFTLSAAAWCHLTGRLLLRAKLALLRASWRHAVQTIRNALLTRLKPSRRANEHRFTAPATAHAGSRGWIGGVAHACGCSVEVRSGSGNIADNLQSRC